MFFLKEIPEFFRDCQGLSLIRMNRRIKIFLAIYIESMMKSLDNGFVVNMYMSD